MQLFQSVSSEHTDIKKVNMKGQGDQMGRQLTLKTSFQPRNPCKFDILEAVRNWTSAAANLESLRSLIVSSQPSLTYLSTL